MRVFKNWGQAVFYYFFAIVEAAVTTAFAFILSNFLDLATAGEMEPLLKFLGIGVAYVIVSMLIFFLFKTYYNKLTYKYMLNYKDAIYSSALKTKYTEGVDSGEYINALTNNAMQVEMMYVDSCLSAPQQFFGFLTGTIAAVMIHPLLFVLIFVFGVLTAFFMKARGKQTISATGQLSQDNEAYSKDLKAQLDANLLLRMEDLSAWSHNKIYTSSEKALSSHLNQKQAMNKTMLTGMTLGLMSTLVVMGACSVLAMKGLVPIGAVLASGHLIGRITSPIGQMGRIYTNYKAGKELKKKIEEQFNISDSNEENFKPSSDSNRMNIRSINLNNLNFSIAEKHILKNINMNFEGGKKYAIVGQAGSGKSTMLKLIAGILDSNSQIKYNEKNLSQQEVFDNICYIPQNITILEETLEENIRLNGNEGSCESLIEKVGLKELAEKRKANGNKIDSTVSGGEKQKIAMARALFKDCSVFLLDEFNSGLDNHSIKQIEDIVTSQADKMVIFITHRLNPETLKKCDEIIYLQDGKIAEHGSFENLLAEENSAFKKFYESGAV